MAVPPKRGRIKKLILESIVNSVFPIASSSKLVSGPISFSKSSATHTKASSAPASASSSCVPASASSSSAPAYASSSSAPASIFDVILSFSGEYTEQNFAIELYRALKVMGIHVFMDSEKFWIRDKIDPMLVVAMKRCKILIPIFSKGYASSKRCLQELAQILECHRSNNRLVWPIFFDVKPSEVRHQTGSFKEPFDKHELEYDACIVERWREALRDIASITGFDAGVRHTFEIITLIVETASTKLNDMPFLVGRHLDGINFHIECMLRLLHLDSMDVRFVGICGPCGIGKTTIAEALYNRIINRFKGSSFLANVNAQAGVPMGLVSLQRHLVCDILQREKELRDVHIGTMFIEQQLRADKVLIVLDDVGEYMQINALVGDCNWFGAGSRIIITTSDEHILHRYKVGEIYKPEILHEYQSLVQGSALFPQSIDEVGRTLQKIKETSDDKLQLINLLQYTGRQIVLNENPKEPMQCNDILEENYLYIHLFVWQQFKDLRVLNLSHCSSVVKIPNISSLRHLNGLILEGCCELVDVHESIGMIEGLIRLDFRSCCKLMQLPGSICQLGALENLILSNCGSVKKLPESISSLKSLVELSLDSTKISELPADVGLLEKLVILDVSGCCNLVKLPSSMTRLRHLRHFNMSRTSIVELPDDLLMHLSLKILEMAKCTKLKGFPSIKQYNSGINCLSHLQVLDLEHCKRLESLPELSSNLLRLNVMGCSSLQVIDLCNLKNLKVLFFGGCDKMVDIPYGFEKLTSLCKLVLCLINSDSLHTNVLSSLRHLTLLDCRKLKSLPELPSSLIELQLIGCVLLEKLPNLSSFKFLKVLNLTGCTELKEIQGLEELKSLTFYDVTLCHCLTDTPMKVQGQGTLKDESYEYEFDGDIIRANFVIGDYEIGHLLVMCLAFSSGHSTIDSCFHGVSDDCILQFRASISRSGRQIHCMNDLVINIDLAGKDEIFIYIHYFQRGDWFGFPLLHGDVIEEIQISSFTGEWNLKFFHLSVENMLQTPSQQPGVENVKDFFNWADEIDDKALHSHPKPAEETTLMTLSRMRQYCKLRQLH